MNINDLTILDIQPTQFYISAAKIKKINKWLSSDDLSNFEPVPIILLNGRVIFTDGHTRAFVAHSLGLCKIPLVWDTDPIDLTAYKIYATACQNRQIYNISHLQARVLPQQQYKMLWNGWCDTVHEVLTIEESRKNVL